MAPKQNLFYYVSDDHHLYAETHPGSGTFDLIYGGDVLHCDWNFDKSLIALLCPDDARTGQHFRTDTRKSMIRIFRVANGEVTDLVDEVETALATCALWVGDSYVVCSNPEGVTTVFELKANRLRLLVQDGGAYPFRVSHGLGIVNREAQSLTIWDLHKDKAVVKETLPNRHAKKGKTRSVCSTCSSGGFSFIMNDDATFHAANGTGKGFKLLKPMISIFSPDTRRPKTSELSSPLVRTLLSCALSHEQVLVAAQGLPDIYRMRIEKKEQTLTVVDKARIDDDDTLVALDTDRCLVKRVQNGSVAHVVVPLEFRPLSDRKKPHPTPTSESPAVQEALSTSRGASSSAPPEGSQTSLRQRPTTNTKNARDVPSSNIHLAVMVGAIILGAVTGVVAVAAVRMRARG